MSPALMRMQEILPLLEAAPPEGSGVFVRYAVATGEAVAQKLIANDTIAACDSHLVDGTIFPVHYHAENEWMFLYSGELLVYVGTDRHELLPGQHLLIPANAPHSLMAHGDVRILAVSMPPSPGFPGVSAA